MVTTGSSFRFHTSDSRRARLFFPQANVNQAIQLLRRRASEGSLPGQRRDGAKLGLVVEGGGMRGAVSGGALQALHDLGLRCAADSKIPKARSKRANN